MPVGSRQAVDDLYGLRRAMPNALGIEATAITADDLDAGVCLQPLGDGQCRALGEQIDHPMAFEITHNGPEALAPSPCPFIESYNPWGCLRSEERPMNEAQNGPATARHAQCVGKRGTSPATHGEADVPQGGVDACAVAPPARNQRWKALGKNAPWTGSVPAEEATDSHMQEDRRPTNRQVGNRAQIGTMDSGRAVLTLRTGSGVPPGFQFEM